MDAKAVLLTTAFHHRIVEANVEAGLRRVAELAQAHVSGHALHDAIASCLRDGLIREPVRLPEGALQCHWHLELTPKGVAAARTLLTPDPEP
jgi:hypothetical protein